MASNIGFFAKVKQSSEQTDNARLQAEMTALNEELKDIQRFSLGLKIARAESRDECRNYSQTPAFGR
jgi:hypothetical protein